MSWAAVTARGTLARWVILASACAVVLLALSGVLIGQTARSLSAAQSRQVEQVEAARQETATLLGTFLDQETGLRGYVPTADDDFLDPFRAATLQTPVTLERLRTHLRLLGIGIEPLAQISARYATWRAFADQQLELVADGDQDAALDAMAAGVGKVRFDALRGSVTDLQKTLNEYASQARETTRDLEQRLIWLVVLAVLGLATVIITGTWVLLAAVAWPVARLAEGSQAVARGHLSAPLPVSGAREIRALARDVTAMRDRLTVDIDVAKRALDAAKQHSPAVTALREALVPGEATVEGLTVAGRIQSAEGVLAGDWYDLIVTGPHVVSLVVGDVSGHGPASAVLALRFRHALSGALKAGAGPGKALGVVSDGLDQIPDDMFATVLVITIDAARNTLTYANAGHPSGLLLGRARSADDAERLEPDLDHIWTRLSDSTALMWVDLPVTGPLLSPIVRGWAWGEREIAFEPGDTMLAFTDGLLEARDPAGEQFGIPRILDVVAESGVDDGPRLLDAICAAAVRHANFRSLHDDQTVLYVRRKPAGVLETA